MTNKFSIRQVDSSEGIMLVKAFNKLLEQEMIVLLPAFMQELVTDDGNDDPVYWEKIRAGKQGFALIAYLDALPVGMALIQEHETAHLESLIIDPPFRHQGLATALIKEAKERCRQHGYRMMNLNVLVNNDKAYACYLKEGFVPYRTNMAVKL
ncbi:hypothetical protein SDC9_104882 [bioreactor metagenome]|uniref:N-acetyltransferase domain-containing protein n=1 Tax=bioreactor metagenome TaxID=1076179 RepID=A0A645B4F8_9ZZZZ